MAATLVATTGVVGGAVGYAALDPAFRKTLGDTVPGSEDLLQLVLGMQDILSVLGTCATFSTTAALVRTKKGGARRGGATVKIMAR